ncbi:hypothetical protein [Pseudomonas folii]|uniref:Holin n=1 Tax=Pseudomonas folii TaxID=2762593 RepID=A0ABR7ATU5_9PSED|nr:hypothetical protein [Pseudomonas folii]MBC3948339.1 hypothetical protein [Pseudomonas folii]
MTTQFLSTFFIAIISSWATWSVLSDKVRDGIVGKLIYAVIALAGYAIVTRAESMYITPTVAGVTFHGSLALAGMRHIFMVTWWKTVKAWLCRWMNCEHCLHHDGRRVKVERRKS